MCASADLGYYFLRSAKLNLFFTIKTLPKYAFDKSESGKIKPVILHHNGEHIFLPGGEGLYVECQGLCQPTKLELHQPGGRERRTQVKNQRSNCTFSWPPQQPVVQLLLMPPWTNRTLNRWSLCTTLM